MKMELVDWVKVVFFLSFILGISIVYASKGDSTTGIGVLFLVIFVILGIILKLGVVKGTTEKKPQERATNFPFALILPKKKKP